MHEQLIFCSSTPTGFFLPSLILLGIGVPLYCLLPKNKTKKMLRANATALICVEWHVAMHSLYQLWIISVAGACKQAKLFCSFAFVDAWLAVWLGDCVCACAAESYLLGSRPMAWAHGAWAAGAQACLCLPLGRHRRALGNCTRSKERWWLGQSG